MRLRTRLVARKLGKARKKFEYELDLFQLGLLVNLYSLILNSFITEIRLALASHADSEESEGEKKRPCYLNVSFEIKMEVCSLVLTCGARCFGEMVKFFNGGE